MSRTAQLVEALAERRRLLRAGWEEQDPGTQSDGLRNALRQYREITQRLLHLQTAAGPRCGGARSTVSSTEGISYTGFHAGSFSAKDETRAAAEAVRRRVRIMSATLYPTLPRLEPVAAPAATRLTLKTGGESRGLLDGAWWPRSRDLLSELPALTDVLDPLWGRITRIAVNPTYWPVIPRRVPVGGHIVKVGWFTSEIDPHKLLLLSYGAGRWDLLVIPPETGAESAARLMTAASDRDAPPLTASALIAADEARHGLSAIDEPVGPDEAWEYEGGACAVSAAVPEQTGPPSRASRLIIGM